MKNPGQHIIAGFQQGSKDAFAEVYNAHYSRLYAFIKKLVDDKEEAQDITTETFVKLWKLHANFNTAENIKSIPVHYCPQCLYGFFALSPTANDKQAGI